MLTTAPCISEEQHHASWCCHKEAANTHKSHKATMEIYFPLALPPLGSTWGGINLSACLLHCTTSSAGRVPEQSSQDLSAHLDLTSLNHPEIRRPAPMLEALR